MATREILVPLTHSRMDCFKTCRKRHWFTYELGIRRTEDAKALRMGSAYHAALEALAKSNSIDDACQAVYETYAALEPFDQWEADIERETVLRLVCGYLWRWEECGLTFLAAEQEFALPLVNPETGRSTPNWRLAGKIDGIVKLEDGRLAVLETKLLSEDLSPDSQLWRRLRVDHQISLYVLAARRLGYAVDCVMYNVASKPTIRPSAVPILDELGAKIVLDARGERVRTEKGCWRQTGDKEKGYTLQTRQMDSTEWGQKLAADIAERPEFYFARVEVPRLDGDLQLFEEEIWDIQRVIRDAQLKDRWYKTCNRNTCSWCPVFDLCTTGWQASDSLPEGYVRVENVNPELGRTNVNRNAPEETTTQPTAC